MKRLHGIKKESFVILSSMTAFAFMYATTELQRALDGYCNNDNET